MSPWFELNRSWRRSGERLTRLDLEVARRQQGRLRGSRPPPGPSRDGASRRAPRGRRGGRPPPTGSGWRRSSRRRRCRGRARRSTRSASSRVAASATTIDQGCALGLGWNSVIFVEAGMRRKARRAPSGDQAGSPSLSTLGSIQRRVFGADVEDADEAVIPPRADEGEPGAVRREAELPGAAPRLRRRSARAGPLPALPRRPQKTSPRRVKAMPSPLGETAIPTPGPILTGAPPSSPTRQIACSAPAGSLVGFGTSPCRLGAPPRT